MNLFQKKSFLCPHSFVLICISLATTLSAQEPKATLPEKHFTFLEKYCLDCHDADTTKGDFDLENLPFNIETIEQAEHWQKVLEVMNSGEMPPEDKRQPSNEEKASILDDLSNVMVTARRILSDSGGKITMRRLNKRDYQNSIESLTGVKLAYDILPDDGASGDLDTVGASLFISADKFEQYLRLGRKAIDEFYQQRTALKAKPFKLRIEPETIANPALKGRLKTTEDFFKRWRPLKEEIDQFIQRPDIKATLAKAKGKQQKTLRGQYQILDRLKQKDKPSAKKYGFRSLDDAANKFGDVSKYSAYHQHFYDLPHRDRGAYFQLVTGNTRFDLLRKKMPVGTYKLRVSAGAVKGSPAYRHFIEIGHPGGPIANRGEFEGFPITSLHVTGTHQQPEVIETEIVVTPDTLREFAVRERRPTSWGALRKLHNREQGKNGYGHDPAVFVDWIELEGPIATPQTGALAKIYSKYRETEGLSDINRARNILNEFAIEAFRTKQPNPAFIESMMTIFKSQLATEKNFDLAIRKPLSIILASPRFVYLNEAGDEKPNQLSDLEAAVRLSYFLWSSPPDEQLLALVKANTLRDKKVLSQQVDRMLKDPKAHNFVSGLAHQWLDMKRLDFFQFNPLNFREFDESFRSASREEVYQTLLHLLNSKNSGQLHNLLKSDYVVVNAMMAAHYGIDGVEGDQYRKVPLPEKSPRGGLLGMAAIHVMGSDGNESSPVERGVWVLRHLLHDPPPPAPANVPQLSRLADQKLSKKQKLIVHQEEAQCASCHRKIDPIGFGLENFDAIGKWRRTDEHARSAKNKRGVIDASGAFHKGPSFSNFFELRERIYDRKDEFARGFTETLIEYGLGRPFAITDETLAQEILSKAQSKDYHMREFVQALVHSEQFWTK